MKPASAFRLRLAAFVLCAVATLFLLNAAMDANRTLRQLTVVESGRDRWQRPAEIISALNLHPGSVVADVGCGSGYFSLKLSREIGKGGKVFAVDIRMLPLAFLWMRTFQQGMDNVHLIHGDAANLTFPGDGVDAVLIVNTYHEFTDPASVLGNVFRSLHPDGRLEVIDRSPGGNSEAGPSHEVASGVAANQIRKSGFEVVVREEKFIDRKGDDPWWQIVAVKGARFVRNP